ncbi:MAG: O-antigen ligase family protein [Deltaproteobacteria bacterium]|nr:O-antigen ligase family protein [Deltaproteobacteria bacterium]
MRSRDQISFGLLAAALLGSVLMVGGVARGAQAVVAVLVAGALGVQLFSRRSLDRVSPLLVFLGIAVLLTTIQLIPLPAGLRELLDPTGEALRRDGALVAGTAPWTSLSLDPPGTLRGVVFFTILSGTAVLSLRFAASERGRFGVLAAVAGTCGIAAAVAGVHTLLQTRALYGIYEPAEATPRVLGPLLNGNHFGSLMAAGAVLSIGLAFHVRQRVGLRVLWICNAVACLLVLSATLSRGAALAFAFGLAIAGAAMLVQRFQASDHNFADRRRRTSSNVLTGQLPIAIVIAFGLGLAIYSSSGKVASQLDNTTLAELSQPSSKYAAWRSSVKLVTEAPWFGIGRGAFEPTFTRIHDPAGSVTFSHLENEYLQTVVELGLVGAGLLAVAFGWCLLAAFRRWRDGPLAAAALGAIGGVLLQSTVDFGLELLGLAVPMTMVAATVLVVPLRERSRDRSRWLARPVIVRGATIGALAVAALLVMQPFARSVQEDHTAMLDGPSSLEDVTAVIERHPFDYFGFGYAAGILMRSGDPRAVVYLNHALRLHPTHPGLHRLAAQMLVAERPSQAAIQYALALSRSASPGKLIDEILTLLPRAEDAAGAFPAEPKTVEPFYRELIKRERKDVALRWLARVIERPQRDIAVVDRLYDLAVAEKAYDVAERAVRVRLAIARTTTSRLKLAKVHVLRGATDRVLADLADVATWRGRIDEKAEAWLIVCDVHVERRNWDKAVECLHRLDGSGTVASSQRPEIAKRLNFVKEQRNLEARLQTIERMKRQLPAPPPNQPPPNQPPNQLPPKR